MVKVVDAKAASDAMADAAADAKAGAAKDVQ